MAQPIEERDMRPWRLFFHDSTLPVPSTLKLSVFGGGWTCFSIRKDEREVGAGFIVCATGTTVRLSANRPSAFPSASVGEPILPVNINSAYDRPPGGSTLLPASFPATTWCSKARFSSDR